MRNWSSVALGDIFDIARGGSPRPIQNFITSDSDGINWIMIGDASGNSRYITSTKKRIIKSGVSKSRMVNPGDFLLTNSMSFGHPYILKTSGCIHDGWLVLSAKKNNIDQNYFYHLLGSNTVYREFSRRAAGTTVKNLNIDLVRGVKVSLPPLEEQKRIAAILDKADAIRRKRKEAIALTEELLRSTFLDMFGDPVTNPKGWKISNLSDVCRKITDGTHHSPPIVEKGIPYITAKHLKKSGLEFYLNPWFVAEDEHKKIYSRCNPQKGDVLYIKDGATTGIAAINNYDFEFSMLSSLALLKIGNELTSEYLCDWLNSENVKKKHLTRLAGAAITRLTLKKIKDFHIPVPPLKVQNEYKNIRRNITKLKSDISNDIKVSETLFNSLLQKAFRGEL